jgi:hypothetical protein
MTICITAVMSILEEDTMLRNDRALRTNLMDEDISAVPMEGDTDTTTRNDRVLQMAENGSAWR